MSRDFKIPFFKSKRDSLAINLFLDAKLAANAANKARTIKDFIENYDIVLNSFEKLSAMNGRVTSVKGDLTGEYRRLKLEFQQHFYDAIDRSGDQIIDNYKGLYKYDDGYIKHSIEQFGSDINKYISRGNSANQEFSKSKYRYVCHECGMSDLIYATQSDPSNFGVDVEAIMQAERIWQRKQQGISESEYELSQIDSMEGHAFEYWCADILRENGFKNVEVTQGSGDQGVDVLAEKDGIKYAIQCKCYSSDLGNTPVQEVNAGKIIYHCHVGVVMTNRYFTSGAKKAAEATSVLLWDRSKLKELINNKAKE
uniref:Restriction endonuclease n=1 Tax=Siphoviridae sp. ct5co22 TaxID=2826294 RepID=A0A8S5QV45_9CAUD|nr:MAG TPA: Restriction endonuclease [Siphoviridae sp. ct5co22]